MRNYSRFESAYAELMDKSLSIELRDDDFIVSYNSNGNIKSDTISKQAYANLVEETRYRMKLSVNAIYIPGELNCFIEKEILYLDDELPFADQMKCIDDLKTYFFIGYRRIKYDGPLSFMEKLLNSGSFIKYNEDKDKSSILTAKIKLQMIKLDSTFKNYVEQRIKQIYSSPEERLESITDLTKPIGNIEIVNVEEELEKLLDQMEELARATYYINALERERKSRVIQGIENVDEQIKNIFQAQINDAYQECYSVIRTNTINEIEGRDYQPLEEIVSEYKEKIKALYKLLTDYYAKNISIYELMYGSEGNYELIIARINSIHSYYGISNPYTDRINMYKTKIKESLKKQQDCNELVEIYKKFLNKALKESEDVAFNCCIQYWKNYQNQIIYVNHSMFTKIGAEVEEYSKAIKQTIEYQKSKVTGYRKEGIEETVKKFYDEDYQRIIDKIKRVYYERDNKNRMVSIDQDTEYEKLLAELHSLTSRVKRDLKNIQRQNSIQNLLNDNMENETVDDESFNMIFQKVSTAHDELKTLEKFTAMKELFNYSVIVEHIEQKRNEYQGLIERIYDFYQKAPSEEEYNKLLADLDQLILETRTICENENKLINKYDSIAKQKKLI